MIYLLNYNIIINIIVNHHYNLSNYVYIINAIECYIIKLNYNVINVIGFSNRIFVQYTYLIINKIKCHAFNIDDEYLLHYQNFKCQIFPVKHISVRLKKTFSVIILRSIFLDFTVQNYS